MKKYGKSSADIIRLKNDFFIENIKRLNEARSHADAYKNQKSRDKCKICDTKLPAPDFVKLGVGYSFCSLCGHLSGIYEDTNEYCDLIYTKNGGENYARNYYEHDLNAYKERVEVVYKPKAQFLRDSLREHNQDLEHLKVLDLGAGSGYFVSALLSEGVDEVKGYEVSQFQVDFANEMIGSKKILCNHPDDLPAIVTKASVDVVTFIGVMEHLQDPISVLKAAKQNSDIKYIYFCVPMFSLSVYLEMVFSENVMPRQLTGGHTHLFTNESLQYLENKFDFERVAEWWFGSDMMDFYRSIYVQQDTKSSKSPMTDRWKTYFADVIDDLQLVLDERFKSSQVHILWKLR